MTKSLKSLLGPMILAGALLGLAPSASANSLCIYDPDPNSWCDDWEDSCGGYGCTDFQGYYDPGCDGEQWFVSYNNGACIGI
jgi:hypothetical protein